VAESVVVDPDGGLSEVGPMVKLVDCLTRKPGMTPEEFSGDFADVHGPIGRRIPGLRRLVQSHALPQGSDGRTPDFDGMAELWFDDTSALLAARESAGWRASSVDEVNFVGPTRTAYFLSEEHEIP
jgi:uncharacterized protein (TIGR02118 family)